MSAFAVAIAAQAYFLGPWSIVGFVWRKVLITLSAAALFLALSSSLYRHGFHGYVVDITSLISGALASFIALRTWRARSREDRSPIVDIESPIAATCVAIIHGGPRKATNAHHGFGDQHYALDAVVIRGGWRARSLRPASLDRYYSFGATVIAPLDAMVESIVDTASESRIGQPFDENADPRGNHVTLAAGDVRVLLAHLRPGSCRVTVGQHVKAGDPIGEIGNSGNSTEPHLHIHATTDGRASQLRVRGRVLVRNDIIATRSPGNLSSD